MKTIYYSTQETPFSVMSVQDDFEVRYPFINESPSPDFIKPVYDWRAAEWKDGYEETLLDKVTEATNELKEIKQTTEDLTQDVLSVVNDLTGTVVEVNQLVSNVSTLSDTAEALREKLQSVDSGIVLQQEQIETVESSLTGINTQVDKQEEKVSAHDLELLSTQIALVEVYELLFGL